MSLYYEYIRIDAVDYTVVPIEKTHNLDNLGWTIHIYVLHVLHVLHAYYTYTIHVVYTTYMPTRQPINSARRVIYYYTSR